MAKQGFKVLDSDLHIMEPPDLWQRYIEPDFRDQAPRARFTSPYVKGGQSAAGVLVDSRDRPWGVTPQSLEALARKPTGHAFGPQKERIKYYEERGWTAEAQLELMDQEGVDVAVLYPTRGLLVLCIPDMEPRLAGAVAMAYNNWLYDFCQADPKRLIGAGMVSPFDVEDAVSESRRCINELGFRGVFMRPNVVNGRNWHDPYYEPLWSTLEELDVPVGLHEASGAMLRHSGEQFGGNYMLEHTFCHPLEQMMATGSFCGGGILERHPSLRVAFLEANCSWLPFLLWRLDEHWEWVGDIFAPDLKMPPSEYFKRQCFASVEPDEEPVKYVIDYMGSDRLLFSTDFPHGDSRFPHAVSGFLELPMADEDKRKILWDNCAYYYGMK